MEGLVSHSETTLKLGKVRRINIFYCSRTLTEHFLAVVVEVGVQKWEKSHAAISVILHKLLSSLVKLKSCQDTCVLLAAHKQCLRSGPCPAYYFGGVRPYLEMLCPFIPVFSPVFHLDSDLLPYSSQTWYLFTWYLVALLPKGYSSWEG